MNFPTLPQKNKKNEAKFGLKLRKWLEANPMHSSVFELKQTTSDSISFSCVEPHQLDYLSAISGTKGKLMRIQGSLGEPDYAYFKGTPAYIFIQYPKGFVGITIGTYLLEMKRSKRKSLTYSRAKDIAVIT